jgi:hypothetical protein
MKNKISRSCTSPHLLSEGWVFNLPVDVTRFVICRTTAVTVIVIFPTEVIAFGGSNDMVTMVIYRKNALREITI